MDREDIIRMAREAGLPEAIIEMTPAAFERFAALVAAAEREACELIVEECLYIVEGEDDLGPDTKSVRLAMKRMKQHFGIKS